MSEETLFNLEDNALFFTRLGTGVNFIVIFQLLWPLVSTDRLQSALEWRCIPKHMVTAPTETRSDIAFAVSSEHSVELSIVMPCLNDAETLATCINKAQRFSLVQAGHHNREFH